MKYIDLFYRKSSYKYSANLQLDMYNKNRIGEYIPNSANVAVLKEFIETTAHITSSTVHASILYGAYGTGKSHLLTILSAIWGRFNNDTDEFKTLVNSIGLFDNEIVNDINKLINVGKPYFIVPVQSSFKDFEKCIVYSLKKELEKNNIEIIFNNKFDKAVEILQNWRNKEESNQKLLSIAKQLHVELDVTIKSLNSYEKESLSTFEEIYKVMTYGTSYEMYDVNMLEDIKLVNKVISNSYRGIIFIFDEFGKYVEDCGENIQVKSVQDLAEYCDHAEYDNFVVLVTHKQLSLYTANMKKELADEWQKVEGRFKFLPINSNYNQSLDLIAHVIPKTQEWSVFKNTYSSEIECLKKQLWNYDKFLNQNNIDVDEYFDICYPMHPIAVYVLDRLSRKIAQSDRTIFTFFAGDEEYSLYGVLSKFTDDRFHFVGIDTIFDYFYLTIANHRGDDIFELKNKYESALAKLGNSINDVNKKLLKVLCIIHMINDPSVISATHDVLVNLIDENIHLLNYEIENLENRKIIKNMRQYGYYDFFDSSNIDIENMISENIDGISDESIINTLNEEFITYLVYPHAYNKQYHVNRAFLTRFAWKSALENASFISTLPKYYDGVVLMVLDRDFHSEDYENYNKIAIERFICCVNIKPSELIHEVKRYIAIKYLNTKKDVLAADDPLAIQEIGFLLNEQYQIVEQLVNNCWNPKLKNMMCFCDSKSNHNGTLRITTHRESLSEYASDLMYDNFPKALIVNNDLLNKDTLTSTIKTARRKAIDVILQGGNLLGNCVYLSPEYNIIRSTLVLNGIFISDKVDKSRYNIDVEGHVSGADVVKKINNILQGAFNNQLPFSDLIKQIKIRPFGLKDGYIPVLLSYLLNQHDMVSFYFHGIEKDFDSETLIKACENPEDYTVRISVWSKEKAQYISTLRDVFKHQLALVPNTKNQLKNLHAAMTKHFVSLSKYARTTNTSVSKECVAYREFMNVSCHDYNMFFFETLAALGNNYENTADKVKDIIYELDQLLPNMITKVNNDVHEILNVEPLAKISKALETKFRTDWYTKYNQVFDAKTNAFLKFVANLSGEEDDEKVNSGMANIFTGFEVDYWGDNTLEDFKVCLSDVITKVNNYQINEDIGDNEIKLVIQTGQSSQLESRYSKKKLSMQGQTMLNKMRATLSSIGRAVPYEEKIQVIVELLKDNIV